MSADRAALKQLRTLLTRIATNACQAKAWLDIADRERGEAHAAVLIGQTEHLAMRARALLIQDPELRADVLADIPKDDAA